MIIRTQENYKTDASAVVRLAIDLLTRKLTLFNTGGMDLPGARDLQSLDVSRLM